jgi:endonuclease III
MIDPTKITKFDRTPNELIEFWLFCVMVAGKPALRIAPLLERLLANTPGSTNFEKVQHIADPARTMEILQQFGIAPYKDRRPAFQVTGQRLAANPAYLSEASVDDLATIPGASFKTARIFVLHSRPNQRYAVLDTHILSWLRSLGIAGVPKVSPTGAKYLKLEQTLLEICRATNCDPASLDLRTWEERHRRIRPTAAPKQPRRPEAA